MRFIEGAFTGADTDPVALKLWHLGAFALVLAAAAASLLVGRPSFPPVPTVSAQRQEIEFADMQATDLVSARYWRARQPQRDAKATAISHVRWAIPDVESYSADNVAGNLYDPDIIPTGPTEPDINAHDSGYTGMTFVILKRTYDWYFPSDTWVNPTDPGYPAAVHRVVPSATHYCVLARSGGWYAWKLGPAAPTLASRAPDLVCQKPG